MATKSELEDQLESLKRHLESQLEVERRTRTFDMDDGPEIEKLAAFPALHTALEWLEEKVGRAWRRADAGARRSQWWHRFLARVSISAGTAAIILAVAQLAFKEPWTHIAAWLEGMAVLAAVLAVTIGLFAKFNRRWLNRRHRAELLRMLKFRALGRHELWCDDLPAWHAWVEHQLKTLKQFNVFSRVEDWATAGDIEPLPTPPSDKPRPKTKSSHSDPPRTSSTPLVQGARLSSRVRRSRL